MPRIGVRLENDPRLNPEDYHDLAALAEGRGYGSVWVPEGAGRDSPTLLSSIAMGTGRVNLGTGIIPIFSRTPMSIAMTAAGLATVSRGRFILGLGVGHRPSVENGQGVPFTRPMSRLRDTINIVRGLLKGEQVTYQGPVFRVRNAGLGGAAPKDDVPIYIAALGPQMLELAGELADGVLLNWTASGYLEQAIEHVREGAAKARRDPAEIDIAGYVRVAVVDDAGLAREGLQRQIVRYASNPFYRNFFEQTGFHEEMSAVERALQHDDVNAAAQAISREMQDQVAAVGGPEECALAIEKRRSLGLRSPVIAPFPVGDPGQDYQRAISAFRG